MIFLTKNSYIHKAPLHYYTLKTYLIKAKFQLNTGLLAGKWFFCSFKNTYFYSQI